MSYVYAGTIYRSKGQLVRDFVHNFITAHGANSVEEAKRDVEENLREAALELYYDYRGDEYIDSLEEARELLMEWADNH